MGEPLVVRPQLTSNFQLRYELVASQIALPLGAFALVRTRSRSLTESHRAMPVQYTSLLALVAAINSETAAIHSAEPKEIHALCSGKLKIGSNSQYFTTWDFANGMIRDQSMYTWYPILLTFKDPNFSVDQAITLAKRFDTPYSNYLRYSGFPKMGAFAVKLLRLLPRATDRMDTVVAIRSFLAYLNCLAAWSFHFFPWGLGEDFSYTPSPAAVSAATRLRTARDMQLPI